MSLSNPNSSWEFPLPVDYTKLNSAQRRAVRQQYAKEQGQLCAFCGSTLYEDAPQELRDLPIDWDLFPEGFLDYPVHLQHNHDTGMTEGAVHSFCNAFMWNYYRR